MNSGSDTVPESCCGATGTSMLGILSTIFDKDKVYYTLRMVSLAVGTSPLLCSVVDMIHLTLHLHRIRVFWSLGKKRHAWQWYSEIQEW